MLIHYVASCYILLHLSNYIYLKVDKIYIDRCTLVICQFRLTYPNSQDAAL